ncbi:MAG: glycosyltransferase [Candidatus Thorarchaeota archaeon]
MNIVYVYADVEREWNCSEWRCAIPTRAINKDGEHHADMVFIKDWVEGEADATEKTKQADIVIVQRNAFGDVLRNIHDWRIRGKPVAIDVDDGYHVMPRYVNAYSHWIEGKSMVKSTGRKFIMPYKPFEQLIWGVKMCDGLTTPSFRLAQDWQEYTEHVHVVPNYPDIDMYKLDEKIVDDEFIIGWGGSHAHIESWKKSGIISALRAVVKENDHVKLLLAGDPRVKKLINLPRGRVEYQKKVPHSEWHTILKRFNIGIVPLAGEYDKRRSWIKALEYMIVGIPWIGTDYDIYGGIQHPYGQMVDNTYKSWYGALTEMVTNYPTWKRTAEAGQQMVLRNYAIDINVNKIIDTYAYIIDTYKTRRVA